MNWSAPLGDSEAVVINTPTAAALFQDIERRFDASTGFTVATLNLDHVVKLRRDPAFRAAYSGHTHVVADGNPVVWLARLAGQHDVRLAPGSELVVPVAGRAARHGIPVALFGSTPDSLEDAAIQLREQFPDLQVACCLSPPMGFDPAGPAADEAIERLQASGARLVFLALGAPKQEIFAARHARGWLHVGGRRS